MNSIANTLKQIKLFRFTLIFPTFLLLTSFFYSEGSNELKFGKKIPLTDKQLKNIDNSLLSLNDLKKENGLIIVFSCNTCPFVVGNEDFAGWENQYNDLYQKAEEKGLGFVLINSNEAKRDGDDSLDEMKIHARKAGYKMPYLVDENSELADAYGAKTTPHVFVVNKESELVYKGSIDNLWDTKRTELETYLYDVMNYLSDKTELKNNDTSPRGCSIKRMKN
jgi:peroxiredoxin